MVLECSVSSVKDSQRGNVKAKTTFGRRENALGGSESYIAGRYTRAIRQNPPSCFAGIAPGGAVRYLLCDPGSRQSNICLGGSLSKNGKQGHLMPQEGFVLATS